MAQKPKTKKSRILSIAAWAFILLIGFLEIARSHGNPPFLSLLQIAVAIMVIFSEVKNFLEERP
jgi:hypothetical protein